MNSDDIPPRAIPGLRPRGPGHQFAVYGDACSGLPGGPNAAAFAATNAVVARLDPAPEFILFLGDEIVGLSHDAGELRRQWRHWHDVEMAWLDRAAIPLFQTTSNHTTFDAISERVFAEEHRELPRNGPADQPGLSYWLRRGDLLLVVVNTCWSGLGGEGHVETAWLESVLAANADAEHKLVAGHHPVWPVNGFAGERQRTIVPHCAEPFWRLLVAHGVAAYLCSHILAFDVQVHQGVPQILSAGAGTRHRMPEEFEYLHAVQMTLDGEGLRYQVLDQAGAVRERLTWPPAAAAMAGWRIAGRTAPAPDPREQTLFGAAPAGAGLAPLWVGLAGPEQRLTVLLAPEPGRSPHAWLGPALAPDAPFELTLALHGEMGPGGVLMRAGTDGPWSSLPAASPWGPERLGRIDAIAIGHGAGGPDDRPFRGLDLQVLTV